MCATLRNRIGKALPRVMEKILELSGTSNQNVLEGPRSGLDNSVVRLTNDLVLISSTDPVSFIPSIPTISARLSVHSIASDIAASGLRPRYALFDLNLPIQMSDNSLLQYWKHVHLACRDLGIAIVGGHTGRFHGCDYTIIGGCTMFAVGREDAYVTSRMAVDGDDLIATKSAAIEATAVLASTFPRTVSRRLGRETLENSRRLLKRISTVEDSLVSASTGLHEKGVTAMHDVTEGGVLSAVLDVAKASGLKATLNEESIPVFDEVRQVCRLFRIDPLKALGQGCLIIAARPEKTGRIIRSLEKSGIPASQIGNLSKRRGPSLIKRHGRLMDLTRPASDPYWRAYWRAVQSGLR